MSRSLSSLLNSRTSSNRTSDCIDANATLNSRMVTILWMALSISGFISDWNVMDSPNLFLVATLLKGITAILKKTLCNKKKTQFNTPRKRENIQFCGQVNQTFESFYKLIVESLKTITSQKYCFPLVKEMSTVVTILVVLSSM